MFSSLPLLLLPLLTYLPAVRAAALLSLNTTLLQPWQIARLSTHSPSGYPANHPYSRLRFTVADPNAIVLGPTRFGDAAFPPQTANCTVWWLGYEENPRDGGWVNTCAEADTMGGKWTFRVLEGSAEGGGGVTTNFGLAIVLEEAVVLGTGGVVKLTFEGEAAFRVASGEDGNMAGSCGGSGVCSWGLKEASAPVLVRQRLVEMKCVAGTCEVDA